MAKIHLNHLYKDYSKDVRAVTDFDLEINDEEFIVLVGPSGCGKSTTLRMIAGLEDITSGEIYIDGKMQNNLHPKDRDIAMVFQNYALYPHMNVFDNIAFGLKMRKMSKKEIEKRVNEVAHILEIESLLDRKPKELSGGQRQRVALGRAIAREAKLFLMDEPLSNLDAKLRFQTRAEITKLHRRLKTTTIYVTHDQTEAMSMATRIVVMKDGLIQQIGTPREIYLKPVNVFVGKFIGSPAMNFMDVTIIDGKMKLGNQLLSIPEQWQNVFSASKTNEFIIGIRPENIILSEMESNLTQSLSFQANVEMAELMGSETLLYFQLNGEQLISKLNVMDDFEPGKEISFQIDWEHIHFFDKKTEMRIEAKEAAAVKEVIEKEIITA